MTQGQKPTISPFCAYCLVSYTKLVNVVDRDGFYFTVCEDGTACVRRKMHQDGVKLLPHPKNPAEWVA